MRHPRITLGAAALTLAAVGAVLSPPPANAAGNTRCATGQAKDGAYLCALTTVVRTSGGLRARRIELWIGGNRATLEGGGCGESGPSAARVESLSIVRGGGALSTGVTTWGPVTGNLCESQGYTRTWTMDEPVRCNRHQVAATAVLHDNGGADKRVHLAMDAETC
jgi:hypothetical protein